MDETVTNALAAAAQPDVRQSVHDFIYRHVMYHTAELDQWNVPFMHVRALDMFRSDGFMVFFGAALLILLFLFGYKRGALVQKGVGNALELMVQFIRDTIAIEFLGPEDGRRFTPLFCSFFFFIAFLNFLGLIPIFSTATSNINVTGALAAVTAGFMVFGAIYRNGFVGFLKTFLTPGVPAFMQVMMVPLEVVSFVSKIAALMIRLFANMLAGHIVIFAMLGMVVIVGWYALPMVLVAVAIFFFELFIAFFQAYIFTLLSAVFIGQTYSPHH